MWEELANIKVSTESHELVGLGRPERSAQPLTTDRICLAPKITRGCRSAVLASSDGSSCARKKQSTLFLDVYFGDKAREFGYGRRLDAQDGQCTEKSTCRSELSTEMEI